MLEIEVKLIGLDEKKFLNKLLEKGASFDVEEHQTNVRINSDKNPIPDPSYLRLRKIHVEGEEDQYEFTFKSRVPGKGARFNEETTSLVENPEAILKIMSQIGFDRQLVSKKRRVRYLYKDFKVEFDEWDKNTLSYPYIEVEAPSKEELDNFLSEFNISSDYVSTKSISELTKMDKKTNKNEES